MIGVGASNSAYTSIATNVRYWNRQRLLRAFEFVGLASKLGSALQVKGSAPHLFPAVGRRGYK